MPSTRGTDTVGTPRWERVSGLWMLLEYGLLLAQVVAGVRVLARLIRTTGGERIRSVDRVTGHDGAVSALVPVLNERSRLGPCLDGLVAQGSELGEILVLDGGSTDGTQELVAGYAQRDSRVRLIDASEIPDGWNGKAWGLEIGAQRAAQTASWLLTIDADVRPKPPLVASLLAHATRSGLAVLSVATKQELASRGTALIHPALLTTLVYRFGIPGHATQRPAEVQANGQCMLLHRDALERIGRFRAGRLSLCDDVTVARAAAADDWAVGFYESDGLVSTRMYESGWETFTNWTRSLPLRDHLADREALVGLLEVTLVQALPLVILVGERLGLHVARPVHTVNVALLATRLGVLVGTARAYTSHPTTYWLSPLVDLPAVVQLWRSALMREQQWRGRTVFRGDAA